MAKCNQLSIDVDGLWKHIQDQFLAALTNAEEKLIETLKIEILFSGAGKMKWREEAAESIKEVSRELTDDYIKFEAGQPKDFDSYANDKSARIQVALWGNQEHGPIRSKPGGEVYGDEMDGMHLSNALSNWDIPQFDQTADGENMLNNAIKITQTYFKDAIKSAWASITFYDYVHVTAGG